MEFAHPWLWLFLLPLAAAGWRLLRRGRRSGIRFSAVRRLPAKTAGWRAQVAALAPFILLAGLALLTVAAARPRSPLNRGQRSVDAIAIAMTVDVSGSMDALDLSPRGVTRLEDCRTRLDVVKDMFSTFVAARPDDLIGLVTFGGYASSRAPLTADHDTLLHVLKGVEIPTTSFDAQGRPIDPEETMTAIGDGLSVALARLKNAEVKSKIVILLSDGVSNTGAVEPDVAAATAAKMGVKVYVIGVGTRASRVPVRTRDAFGRWTVAYANMAFDESQLKSIAAATQGRYFAVNDADGLKAALDEIDALEKTTLDREVFQRYREHFVPFLLAGAALALLAVSLQMAASRRLA